MMHAMVGRKPKPDVSRYPCGKIREELPESVIAVALAPRLRSGVRYDDAVVRDQRGQVVGANQDAGHTLGLLRLRGPMDPGGISDAQYHAGMAYALLCQRHGRIMGYSTGSPKSPGFEMVAGGTSLAPDPDEEAVLRTRRQWSDCYRALIDAGRDIGAGTRVATETYDACLDRIAFSMLQKNDAMRGNVKVGLNALGRVLR
jgi:hypothetical protein